MDGPATLPPPPPPGAAMLPMDAFAGQVVLITGGGSGMGLAMAREFARAGAAVAISSRDRDRRERAVRELEGLGARAVGVPLDVRDPGEVEAAFEAVGHEIAPVDILINNAAANFFSPAEEISLNGWNAVIERVLTGTFLCSREFHKRRLAAGGAGVVLNIGAPTGLTGGPGVAHCAAAKAGVINLTKSLAVEWARDGIRVNCIVPGVIPHGDDDAATRAGRIHFGDDAGTRTVAGRVGQPHEIGWLATFLCSPFSSFITGQIVAIDGGDQLRRFIRQPEFTPIREQIAAQQGEQR